MKNEYVYDYDYATGYKEYNGKTSRIDTQVFELNYNGEYTEVEFEEVKMEEYTVSKNIDKAAKDYEELKLLKGGYEFKLEEDCDSFSAEDFYTYRTLIKKVQIKMQQIEDMYGKERILKFL